jgi:ubiquitin carboxyl-terminal hydrolase 5/13
MAAVCEEVLDKVRAGMRGLKPPGHYDKVYKEECMFSYQTPEAPGGLYVNLKTFMVSSSWDSDHVTARWALVCLVLRGNKPFCGTCAS